MQSDLFRMTKPEPLSGLVIMILSLLRGDLIASKHSQCIVKSVKSIWAPQKACAKWFSFDLKHLSILSTYSSDKKLPH